MTGTAAPRPRRVRWLAIAGVVEALTLAVLLVNLATVHLADLASAVGPVHGTAYLASVILAWTGGSPWRARWAAVAPGVGGLAALALTPSRRGARVATPR